MPLPDRGSPWLFDADRGGVVERYEVYSVHQDAMAPMALQELSKVCREPRFTDAGCGALAWIHGGNESSVDLVDRANGARPSLDSSRVGSRPALGWCEDGRVGSPASRREGATARLTETDPTDRPYHFGSVLEAWCGREGVLGDGGGGGEKKKAIVRSVGSDALT